VNFEILDILARFQAGNAEVILLEREVQILKTIGHAYIIELLHVLETSSTMYLVQEKCDTHLGNYLNQQDDKKLPETQCQAPVIPHKHLTQRPSLFCSSIIYCGYLHSRILSARLLMPCTTFTKRESFIEISSVRISSSSARLKANSTLRSE
jgi:hypothetical protein